MIQNMVGGLQDIGRVNEIVIRVLVFAVPSFDGFEEVLHHQILYLGKEDGLKELAEEILFFF